MTVPPTPDADPADPTPPLPEPTPEEAAAQQAAAEKAAAEAALADQIRALATEIAKQAVLDFDPATLRKGTVASIQTASVPPTVTITISGDTTVEIPGVRYYEHYPPAVGDTVHLIKQGTDLVAVGKIAEQYSETGFVDVTLSAGFTHNGNSNGNLKIRRVWDHGVWRVDLQGGVNRSSGTVIATGLDTKYRPVNATRRTVLCARDANGSNVVKVDIDNTGTMTMVGGATGPSAGGSHNHSVAITDNEHTHQIQNSDHFHGDTDAGGSHTHGIANNDHNHGSPTGTTSGHSHSIATTTHKHGSAADGEPGGTTSVNAHAHNIPVSSHTHGTNGALGTAVTINGDTGTDSDHSHSVPDPVWISFNAVSSYYL